MSETLPRWGLPDVSFIETDAYAVQNSIISTYETISGRTLAVGDPVRLFLLSLADVLIQLRNDVNIAARMNLLSYAQGVHLDALGRIFSVTRLPASAAQTTMRFSLSQALGQNYTIPKGTAVTNGEVTFVTDDELIIAAGARASSVSATCTTPGVSGNDYAVGQVATIVEPMPYVQGAENTTVTAGGSDEEDDAELAERIRKAPNGFSVAGPKKAYVYHTFSVSSNIIDVSVDTPTPGVVNVYPLMEDGRLPSQELLDLVAEHLSDDAIRPLTDDVNVYAPTANNYTINVDYYITNEDRANAETIRSNVSDAVEKYRLWQQTKVGRDITPDKLVSLVMQAGAARINSATLSPSAFKSLQPSQVAQCTSVSVNFAGYKDI